ncbi:MAG: AAA family ATPase [Euryarchaeota archaeon]|nr:MAG: DNA replication and repair protein RecF [ANME-2 cluster archaeon]MEA1864281.1 AAA family ATPase [Euryarchaeota archaeon]
MSGAFISEIDIKEFRGIKRCNEPIRLSKFNVLIGKNNSGKSSLLEALYLFPSPKIDSVRNGIKIDQIRELHSGRGGLVYGYSGNATIVYGVNWASFTTKTSFTIEIASDGGITVFRSDDGMVGSTENISEMLNMHERDLKDISIYIPNDGKTLDEYAKYVSSMAMEIVKSGANKRVAEFVNQCIDEKYAEVLWKRGGLSCRKELTDGSPMYIALDDLGDGIKRATVTMLLLEVNSPRMVLWDDFESALHPTLIGAQLEWLAKRDWQVVLSTHSIDVLYQLLELEIDPADLQILPMRKLNDGTLVHESLTIDELDDLMNANADSRRLVDALGV